MINLTGHTLKGYTFHESIGKGGFGTVYRASQTLGADDAFKREVAVKVIAPEFANDPSFIRRFESETNAIIRLDHIHIVPLIDAWREPDIAFLIMRYMRGGSLSSYLKRNARLEISLVTRTIDQIAHALNYAHRNNIVHRDLKPDNILLDEEENAYLADFGIARDLDIDPNASDTSGSPVYKSPEQFRGAQITTQTDIYTLGMLLFELLAGVRPFADAQSYHELARRHQNNPLPSISEYRNDLSLEVDEVIRIATAKRPTDRHESALVLAQHFRRALGEHAPPDTIINAPETMLEMPNPYKGLRAFQEADADDFFGRDELTERLIARLQEDDVDMHFLAVVGPSGSGKSSVVKAGLIPALRQGKIPGSDKWFIVEMFPGAHPFAELESALLKVAVNSPTSLMEQLKGEQGILRAIKRILPENGELLLVIDQFEEIFTLVEDEATRVQFLNSLLEAIRAPHSPLRVVVTLRADFYDKPLYYLDFGTLFEQRMQTVRPLTPAELEQSILLPAEKVGASFELGLAAAIVKEVGEQPGVLPLLQYTLTELFERREGRTLTLHAYREIGGVTGALAKRADEIYVSLPDAGKEAARQMFLRLVTLGEGTEDTRRRVRRSELESLGLARQTIQNVIDQYGKYRLLNFDHDPVTRGPTVEVAHEALIRTWGQLRSWLDMSREELRLNRRLTAATMEWLDAGKEKSFLASGLRLADLEEWAKATTLALNTDERTYLETSIQQRVQQEEAESKRIENELALERRALEEERRSTEMAKRAAQQQERNARIFRILAAVLALFLLVAIGSLFIAVSQNSEAVNARNEAQLQAEIARNNEITATLAQGEALNQAATATYAQGAVETQATAVAAALAVAQDQAATATVAQGEALIQANVAATQAINAENNAATATIAQGEAQMQANIAATQAVNAENNAGTATIAQGEAIIQADNAATAAVNAQNNAATATIAQGEAIIQANNAATAAVNAQNNAATATIAQGEALEQANVSRSRAMAANAELLLASGDYNQALALSLAAVQIDGAPAEVERVLAFTAYSGPSAALQERDNPPVLSVAASYPYILFGGEDRNGTFLSPSNPNVAPIILPSFETVSVVAFCNSICEQLYGRQARYWAITGSTDGTVTLWDTSFESPVQVFERFPNIESEATATQTTEATEESDAANYVLAVAFHPTQALIFVGYADGEILAFDLTDETGAEFLGPDGRRLEYGGEHDAIASLVISPAESDGTVRYLAATTRRGQIFVWDMENWNIIHDLSRADLQPVNASIFSPDGSYLLTGSADGIISVWDIITGNLATTFSGHTGAITSLAFNSDGAVFISGSVDRSIILWDFNLDTSSLQSARLLRRFEAHYDTVNSVTFFEDQNPNTPPEIVSVSQDGSVLYWDVNTGAQNRVFLTRGQQNPAFDIAFLHGLEVVYSNSASLGLYNSFFGSSFRNRASSDIEHTDLVRTLAVDPIGGRVISGSNDGSLILWDSRSYESIFQMSEHDGSINSVAFSPDGNWAISGSEDRTLMLWNVNTGDSFCTFEGHASAVTTVVFNPVADIRMAASGSIEGDIILWDIDACRQIARIPGHSAAVNSLAFSPNGLTLVSASADRTLILWDVDNDPNNPNFTHEIRTFQGHTESVNSVAFSPDPDGKWIASGSSDHTLILWDTESTAAIRTYVGHADIVWSVTFSADGQFLLSGANDGVIIRWVVHEHDELIDWVFRNRYVVALSCELHLQYNLEGTCEEDEGTVNQTFMTSTPTQTSTPTLTPDFAVVSPTPTLTPTPTGTLSARRSPDTIIDALAENDILKDENGYLADYLDWSVLDLSYRSYIIQRYPMPSGQSYDGDIVMRANIRWGAGAAIDQCGFVFGFRDRSEYSTLMIDQTQQVILSRLVNDEWQESDIQQSDSILTGSDRSNELVIVITGDDLRVFINDSENSDAEPILFSDISSVGEVAIAGRVFGQVGNSTCTFTNVWVWDTREAPPPTSTPPAPIAVDNAPTAVIESLVNNGLLTAMQGYPAEEVRGLTIDLSNVPDFSIRWEPLETEQIYGEFVMGARIRWGPGALEDSCGFILRHVDDSNFYRLEIDRFRGVFFTRLEDNTWDSLGRYEISLSINPNDGATNELVVFAQNVENSVTTRFLVFINGEYVTEFVDDAHQTGSVYLAASTFGASAESSCTFEDAWAWDLEGTSAPTPTPTAAPINAGTLEANTPYPETLELGTSHQWTYNSNEVGEILLINARADRPANQAGDDERILRNLLDIELLIRTPSGTILNTATDISSGINTDAQMRVVLPETGEYLIVVYASRNLTSGGYTLFVERAGVATPTPDQNSTNTVATPTVSIEATLNFSTPTPFPLDTGGLLTTLQQNLGFDDAFDCVLFLQVYHQLNDEIGDDDHFAPYFRDNGAFTSVFEICTPLSNNRSVNIGRDVYDALQVAINMLRTAVEAE